MLGMRSKDASGSAPAKKRTGVMTNSPELADTLAKFQSDSTHRRVVLEGGRPKACESTQMSSAKSCYEQSRKDWAPSRQRKSLRSMRSAEDATSLTDST